MKNCIVLEIRKNPTQVCFGVGDFYGGDEGLAKLLTEEEAVQELERLRQEWPDFKFQIVVLRLGETTEFDRTD